MVGVSAGGRDRFAPNLFPTPPPPRAFAKDPGGQKAVDPAPLSHRALISLGSMVIDMGGGGGRGRTQTLLRPSLPWGTGDSFTKTLTLTPTIILDESREHWGWSAVHSQPLLDVLEIDDGRPFHTTGGKVHNMCVVLC